MYFDLCFSNPPYTKGVDLKIITQVSKICKEMVVVHPSTWLIDIKGKWKPYNDTKELLKDNIKSTTLFNGNPVFDIELFVPCVITHIDKNKIPGDPINVELHGREFQVIDINDVTVFGPEWLTLVKPFYLMMKEYTNRYGSIWDHNVKKIVERKHYCQLAAIIGNHCSNIDKMIQDDFYTLVMKNSNENKGIRQPRLDKPGNPTPTFKFETEVERNNFIDYLKTNFVRFCLSLFKIGCNLSVGGVLSIIPWLDFTKKWTDEELYKYFNISKELQNYIENFLPDYYELRGKKI